MTEYQRQRKLLRDYLSRQRRKGITVKTKLPRLVKNPTQKSIEQLQRKREQAKSEAKVSREKIKKQQAKAEKAKEEFAKKPLDEIADDSYNNVGEPVVDLETGEIPYERYTYEPEDDFDVYENEVETYVYQWANSGTQTEYSERIVQFVRQCVSMYGNKTVAEALQKAKDNGYELTRMERYNNDRCHDWIAEVQEAIQSVSGNSFPEDVRKEYEQLFRDANEDTYNDTIDAEVFESRYTGG